MKQEIHPDYKQATIMCACGNTIETMSTEEEIHVEICSVCHPFYTGKQRLVDTAGRVERFKRKYADVDTSDEAEEESGSDGEAVEEEAAAEAPEAPRAVEVDRPEEEAPGEEEAGDEEEESSAPAAEAESEGPEVEEEEKA